MRSNRYEYVLTPLQNDVAYTPTLIAHFAEENSLLRAEDPQTIPVAVIDANRHDLGFLGLDRQREWAIDLIEPLSLKSRRVLISYP